MRIANDTPSTAPKPQIAPENVERKRPDVTNDHDADDVRPAAATPPGQGSQVDTKA